ncbi:MAG: hypothetical protein ABEH78_07945 [Haloferacaceae archaeon]
MEDISNIHEFATQRTNTTGVRTPILEIQPDDGLLLQILNQVARGSAEGVPIYADLKDSTGSDLPLGTSLVFEYERPEADDTRRVSEVRDNIQPYRNLTITEQQDEEYVDAVKLPLLGRALNVRDIDKWYISIDSSAQIDWANSSLYIEGNAVNRKPMD